MTRLPPGKYFWPGAESHESFTNKKFVVEKPKITHTHKKYTIYSSESHSSTPIVTNCNTQTHLYEQFLK